MWESIVNGWKGLWSWVGDLLSSGIGIVLLNVGELINTIGLIGIGIGMFLVMMRIKVVLRWSMLIWLVGLTLQIVGSALM